MKRDLMLAAVLTVLLVGWWTFANTDFLKQWPGAQVEAPALSSTGVAPADPAAAGAAAPEKAFTDTSADGDRADDGTATEAEFLAFVAACRTRTGSDPFYSRFVDNYPACVPHARLINRYNELHVLPYHPVVAENCVEHYASEQDMTAGERCTLSARDIYSGASKDQLLEWIEAGDAVAASLLVAFPTATPQERFEAALAAYRLSGKPAELVRYVDQYVSDAIVQVDRENLEDFIDREPSAIAALNGYVLSRIAKNAGDQRAQPAHWKRLYMEHARHLSSHDFDIDATEKALEALVASQLSGEVNDV